MNTHLNHVLDGDVAEGRAELLVVARQPTDHVELGDHREYALALVVLGHHRPALRRGALLAKPCNALFVSPQHQTKRFGAALYMLVWMKVNVG